MNSPPPPASAAGRANRGSRGESGRSCRPAATAQILSRASRAEHKVIDSVSRPALLLYLRQGGPHRLHHRPVRSIGRPFVDPPLQEADLLVAERDARFFRRHPLGCRRLPRSDGPARSHRSCRATIAVAPLSSGFTAPSRTSSRKPASRCVSSGPWQAKHFLARIGRISRLKSTGRLGGASCEAPRPSRARATRQ